MNAKGIVLVVLFVIVLLGATGGDESVRALGTAIRSGAHWVAVAWNAIVGAS